MSPEVDGGLGEPVGLCLGLSFPGSSWRPPPRVARKYCAGYRLKEVLEYMSFRQCPHCRTSQSPYCTNVLQSLQEGPSETACPTLLWNLLWNVPQRNAGPRPSARVSRGQFCNKERTCRAGQVIGRGCLFPFCRWGKLRPREGEDTCQVSRQISDRASPKSVKVRRLEITQFPGVQGEQIGIDTPDQAWKEEPAETHHFTCACDIYIQSSFKTSLILFFCHCPL